MKSKEVRLQDFCDMEKLYSLLSNWSKSTGISSFVVDCNGNRIIESYNMVEYCKMISSCEKGMQCCKENWESDTVGVYECHAGFFDFAIPMITPDGTILGRVLAGQILTVEQDVEHIIKKVTEHLDFPEEKIREVLLRTPRKRQTEIEGSYNILKQMIDFFIANSYYAWKENKTLNGVIATAQLGIWRIVMYDGEKPKMICSDKMLELLGIEHMDLSEEEIYEAWQKRIKKSSIPSVNASFVEMLEKGKSEITYVWTHPVLGERFMRCGGTGEKVEGKGYVFCGYHSDVTDTINADMKQKQLLADALEEAKQQKHLLQQALDDYKQADYDRRTDFLTGLKNRQDMYEMLNDKLSGKRKRIKAMCIMDIDNFKMFNDHYGHVAGDNCLKRMGEALNDYGTANDMYIYRYGGEEMLGICFSSVKSADVIAKELVKLIYDLKIERDDLETGVATISLGYTTDSSDYDKMLDKADAAMYEAKSRGKNQAVCFETM